MSGAISVGIAAISIGVAADTASTFAIVAAVGATISAVGAVTHVQALQIAGGVIGAVGAVGGLAASAGLFAGDALSGAANTAGSVASDAGSWASDASATAASVSPQEQALIDAGLDTGTQSAGISSSVMGGNDLITTANGQALVPGNASASGATAAADPTNPVQPVAQNTVSPTVTPASADDTSPALQGPASGSITGQNTAFGQSATDAVPDAGQAVDPNGNPVAAAGTGPSAAPSASNAPAAPGTPAANASVTNTLNGNAGIAPANSMPVTGSVDLSNPAASGSTLAGTTGGTSPTVAADPNASVFSKIGNFITTRGGGTVAAGVIQAGSAFLAGATSSLTPAQVAALNAQAEANQAAAMLSRTQQANMAQPIPVASRSAPVTGTPAQAGLMNTAPASVAVTGAPA